LIAGYNIGFAVTIDGKILDSQHVEYGVHIPGTSRTFVDLAHFDEKGQLLGLVVSAGLASRSLNLARVVEHEYFGHALDELKDDPHNLILSNGPLDPGPNENMLNKLRLQMGVPLRVTYFGPTSTAVLGGISFGHMDKNGGVKC